MTEPMMLPAADGLKLAADVYGPEDGPPLLLLHGMGQTRQSWGQAGERLAAQGWRAYAIDMRGHGDSDWPEQSAYEHGDVGRDVTALCELFEQPPLVVGASMGGVCSLVAQSSSDQQLFRGLVLVDIAPDVDMEGGKRIMSFMAANEHGYDSLEDAAKSISAYRGSTRTPSTSGLAKVLRKHEDGRWHWHWDPRMLDSRKGWINDATAAEAYGQKMRAVMVAGGERLTVPTLLVRGGSSDVVSAEAAQALTQIIPHATFVDVADATHMVAGDKNDAFTQAILDFAEPLLP